MPMIILHPMGINTYTMFGLFLAYQYIPDHIVAFSKTIMIKVTKVNLAFPCSM